jgi:lysozyme
MILDLRPRAGIFRIEDQLPKDEGWIHTPYPDPLTKAEPWTVGVGHTGPDVIPGQDWSDEQIQTTFTKDLREAQADLARVFPFVISLDPVRRGALENMCFQLGITRLRKFVDMFAAAEKHDWPLAAAEALDSTWARQTPNRAQRIAQQLKTGIWY